MIESTAKQMQKAMDVYSNANQGREDESCKQYELDTQVRNISKSRTHLTKIATDMSNCVFGDIHAKKRFRINVLQLMDMAIMHSKTDPSFQTYLSELIEGEKERL